MANNQFQVYLAKVFELAETLVIKSTGSAEAINNELVLLYGERAVSPDPREWKYYLNLAGEYAPHDTVMTVVSMDTLETIVFSKDTLKIHRTTARNYAYGTRYFNELLARYPEQEMLIMGILYPVDLDTAVDAEDGAILGYPPHLIEVNEYSLVAKLQTWIDEYRQRWINPQYAFSDDLYLAGMLGIMYINLPAAIISFRLEACKTEEAHSYHVKQYLNSHGLLDIYTDFLTTKQALFLYRNINYIDRNPGQQDTFEWLIDQILTEREIPLSEFTMRHDIANQPEELYPTLTFRRGALNDAYSAERIVQINLNELLDKEDALAPDNARIKENAFYQIQGQMRNSLSNVVKTKALESSMQDTTNSAVTTMSDVLLNHWLSLSQTGYYTAFVGVNHPRTGERVSFSAKDAFTLMLYAFGRAYDIEMEFVPIGLAKKVLRMPPATVDDLLSVVDWNYVSRDDAQNLHDTVPLVTRLVSTGAFYDFCTEIYTALQYQRGITAYAEHYYTRALRAGMCERVWSDNTYQLEPEGTLYKDWLAGLNFSVAGLTRNDFLQLYGDLVTYATGTDQVNVHSMKDLQEAMIRLVRQLSSYGIQFITEINQSAIRVLDRAAIRLGDVTAEMRQGAYVRSDAVHVQDARGEIHDGKEVEIAKISVVSAQTQRFENQVLVPLPNLVENAYRPPNWRVRINLGGLAARVTPLATLTLDAHTQVHTLPGFTRPTLAQSQRLVDMYPKDTGVAPNEPRTGG